MPSIGFPELIVILMILLVVFGASRLPQLGESLGRTIRGFKRGLAQDDKIQVSKAQGPQQLDDAAKAKSEIADAEIIEKKS